MAAAHAALPGHGDGRKERDAEPLGRLVRRRPRRCRHDPAQHAQRPCQGPAPASGPADQHLLRGWHRIRDPRGARRDRRRPRARRRRHLGARPTLRPGRRLVRKGAPDQHRGPCRARHLAPMIPEPPGAAGPIKLGMLAWNQYTTWPAMREAAVAADRLGYDDIWTWDHLYPIVGSHEGPMLEGWMALAGWASITSRARIGVMVGANPFPHPAPVATM